MQRRDAFAGQYDADQVQRVGGGDDDGGQFLRCVFLFPQQCDRFRPGELFSRAALDKVPAADLAPRFHAPADIQQFPPRRQVGLPFQDLAEQDPVTFEQGIDHGSQRVFIGARPDVRCRSFRVFRRGDNGRPAACGIDAVHDRRPPAPVLPAVAGTPALRRDQRPQPRVAVGGDRAASGKFCQRGFHLCAQQAGMLNQVQEKRRSPAPQDVQGFFGPGR